MEIKIFQKDEFGAIRTAGTAEEPLFCLADVCRVLELQTSRVKDRLNQAGVTSSKVGVQTGFKKDGTPAMQHVEMTFINEQNLYKVIMRSDKPQAEAFQDWVCGEVLPSIRKNGGYIHTTEQDTPEIIMAKALLLAQKTIEDKDNLIASQKQKIEEQTPKALFADAVSASNTSILVGELAKILKQNGAEMGQRRLFDWLRENGYLMKGGSSYNMPTQRSMEQGLFEIKETVVTHSDGHVTVSRTPKVTGRGQIYFINKFNNNCHAVRG